jgi:3-oxoadipyl-CoA thiolase
MALVCGGIRTPFGRHGGALAGVRTDDLAAIPIRTLVERMPRVDWAALDEVVLGCANQAGEDNRNVARMALLLAGLQPQVPGVTVNRLCASGLEAVGQAARAIDAGAAELVLAGGVESMSNTPYLLPRARFGYRLGHQEVVDAMYRDGFNDPLSGLVMGETAEELAREKGITRAAADAYALASQNRCEAARRSGRFKREIVPVSVEDKKGAVRVESDEHPRDGVTADALAKLAPVFRPDGTVTAGNASGITDGAAAVLVTTEEMARDLDLEPAAQLLDWEVVGVEPRIMGIGPVPACRNLLRRLGWKATTVDQIELNEAFASQVLACLGELDFEPQRVNPDGGAIALGHPIGCSGARILVTLVHGLQARGGRRGIATLCVSGGMGLAAAVERVA